MKEIIWLIICMCWLPSVSAQLPTSTVRGTVSDKDSKGLLIGATVRVLDTEGTYADVSDVDGTFKITDIPVGRRSVEVSYLGYEPSILSNLSITAGKELVLNIELVEAINALNEVVITAGSDKRQALNEMALVSARSFSIEESQRYAASFLDPARMAQNYAGVSSAGDDLSNEIVIRGNSPSYIQWRLEGIEIPGPNHFADKGSSGGGISMLSSSMLANSDFYTGAFPAEIGNALAGAFDLRFRNGNNERKEHSLMVGVVGLEASTEGPIGQSGASYLFNYRYSALELIGKIAELDFGDYKPNFQDLSFKINMPTKKAGVFSVFGLLATAGSNSNFVEDPTQWRTYDDIFNDNERNKYALAGLTHRFLFKNQKTYIKTVLSSSFEQYRFDEEFYDVQDFIAVQNGTESLSIVTDEVISLTDKAVRASITLNHKSNARNSFRGGGIISSLGYDFTYGDRRLSTLGDFRVSYGPSVSLIDDKGSTAMIQAFAQWKHRLSEGWTINGGMHYTYLGLTSSGALEPRLALRWQFAPNQSISASAGLHSTAEHLINYTLLREDDSGGATQPNLDLPLTKAAHFVLGYDRNFSGQLRLKVEAYLQHLYDVPVDPFNVFSSILNATSVYNVLFSGEEFFGTGTGRNYGLDLTLERFIDRGFYYLMTASIFDSTFKDFNGRTFNTRYNARYNLTALSGKEWAAGSTGQNIFGLNGKIVLNGGNRYSEVDFENRTRTADGLYKLQTDPYFRIDLSLNYKINKASATHTISLEVQNLTNRKNVFNVFPDFDRNQYRTSLQSGLIPNINYRVEF